MDTTQLLIGVFSGALGFGYFIYGKKQQKIVPLIAGMALCVVPYCIADNLYCIAACVVLAVLPFAFQV
jgi:hypothetical protein